MLLIFWFILFLLFLTLEMLVPGGFYFASLALGALATLGAALVGVEPAWAWAIFFVTTIVAVFMVAPLARRWLRRIPSRPVGFESLTGQRARVVEPVDPATGEGLVKLDQGAVWLARSEGPIPVGAWVEVLEVVGTRLLVRPVPETEPAKEA